jgi:hypothetical protein
MKKIKLIFLTLTMLFLSFIILNQILGKQTQNNVLPDTDDLQALISYQTGLKKENITDFGIWRVGPNENDKIFYITKIIPADEEFPSGSELFRIYDNTHKLIYEEKANGFSGIEIFAILRQSRSQLIIKAINYGGSGRFFKILDFQEGKVICLTNEDDTLYSGDIEILPQYQKDVKYYSTPYQVFLTESVSSPSPEATVLRYVNGKYVSVGKLNQLEVGNFINENLSKEK